MRRAAFLFLLTFSATAANATGPVGGTVHGFVLAADGKTPRYAATDRGLFVYRSGGWDRDESLGVSEITSILHNGDRLIVRIRDGETLVRADGEERWRPAFQGIKGPYGNDPGEVTVLAAEPGSLRRLYLGTDGKGLFTSANAGRNWYPMWEGVEDLPPTSRAVRALLPARGKRPMLMGTDGAGLFAWVGETWVPRGENLPAAARLHQLVDDPGDPLHLALGVMGEGAWESRDGGLTWKLLRKGLFGVAGSISIGEDGAVGVWFNSEGFSLFREGKKSRPTSWGRIEVECLMARRGGGWLAGLRYDGVAEIDASGKLGPLMNEGLVATRILSFVAGVEEGSMWCGDMNGLFYTADGGKNWVSRDEGFPTSPVSALLWREGTLYAGMRGQGVARWSAETQAWEDRSRGLGTANSIQSFVMTADGDFFVGTEGGIRSSDDGAANWKYSSEGLPGTTFWTIAVVEGPPRLLWAASSAGLYRSDDEGAHWVQEIHGDFDNLRAEGNRLFVTASDRLDEYVNGSFKTRFRTGEGDFVYASLLDGDDLWVGSRRGLWLVRSGEQQLLWEGAPVLALGRASDGRIHAGTDGRGVKTFRLAR